MTDAHDYDAFLSYGPADRAEVERIAVRLRDDHGLRLCFDVWEAPAAGAIEQAIERSRSVVVFVGPSASGPWQANDGGASYAYAMTTKRRIIPARLPGALDDDVPGLLRMRLGVDLALEDHFPRLVAGIVGAPRAPAPSVRAIETEAANEIETAPAGLWARLRRWLGRG